MLEPLQDIHNHRGRTRILAAANSALGDRLSYRARASRWAPSLESGHLARLGRVCKGAYTRESKWCPKVTKHSG